MKLKDCSSCPSYSNDSGAIEEVLGRPFNAPVCLRFGYILGAEGQDAEDERNMLQAFADECEDHGKALNTDSTGRPVAVSINTRVAEVDQEVMDEGPTGQNCESCHGCSRLVKSQPVREKFGWLQPLCSAKGELVFSPNQAKNCEFATPGMPRDNVDGIVIRSRYKAGFKYGEVKAAERMLATFDGFEPTTYEGEAPDADDKADGIRTYFTIESPYGDGQTSRLPIFDPSIFSEAEREMIPQTGDAHHPELYVDYSNLLWKFATDCFEDDETLCLQSAPGLGKTQFGYYLAWLMQVPCRRILIGPNTEADDLFGKLLAREGSTYWHDGRYTKAWVAHAGILIVDEPNTATGEVIIPLRSTTDNDKMLALDASDAEDERTILKPRGKYTFQLWCMNQAWDARNIGANDLGMADMSRLTPVVVPYPPEAIERSIIKAACKTLSSYDISDKHLTDIMRVSKLLREAATQNEYPGSWGIREQIKVARKLRRHPFVEAYRLAALYFFDPETQQFVIDNFIKTINADGI